MLQNFGTLPNGQQAHLYTISCGSIYAVLTDLGATLVQLKMPDCNGKYADVVLGFDSAQGYLDSTSYLGATVGRNANRTKGASFCLNGQTVTLGSNDGDNNLHSGPDVLRTRLWEVESCTDTAIRFHLTSPDGDQGFPGNAEIQVTYSLDDHGGLHIVYDAVADRDTVFNFTNHTYFNLAGNTRTYRAMEQILTLPARWFNPDDAQNIPTGERRSVEGTPMDFRQPKPLYQDIDADYEPLRLQGGYDHNFEVFCNPCAILEEPITKRRLEVYTDCPGIQVYTGNFLNDRGKNGNLYGRRSGVALETQFAPDSLHHPDWPQPITKAGENYHSETVYRFSW